MKQFITIVILALSLTIQGQMAPQKNILSSKTSLEDVRQSIILNQKWLPFPKSYNDRTGWQKLFGPYAAELIKNGEKYLDYKWQVVPTTAYLAFDRTGDRNVMQKVYSANQAALSGLFAAEIAEGKGRFIDQIIDGSMYLCDMTSWSLSAHLTQGSKTRTAMPDDEDNVLELSQGDLAQLMSWIYFYLKDELAKVSPIIPRRIYKELKRRELDDYLVSNHHWWMGFQYYPDHVINNWNTWCNYNALLCFMLLENDPDRLTEAVWKSIRSMDKYLDYVKADGACEEGPSYWSASNGYLFDYLQALSLLTGGKISYLHHPTIKAMGEYVVYSAITDNWVVNFADAAAREETASPLMLYRYGKETDSGLLMGYAAAAYKGKGKIPFYWSSPFRAMEQLLYVNDLKNQNPMYQKDPCKWYPETEFCYLDNQKGLFLAAKGGHNNESHNHNDIGSCIFFAGGKPILIDIGVENYCRKTFSPQRYEIWTMQSQYHNLPIINGCQQKEGKDFKARNVAADLKKLTFSLDISGAYTEEAAVEKWQRTYALASDELTICDDFSLRDAKAPCTLNYMTYYEPRLIKPGTVQIGDGESKIQFLYDTKNFDFKSESISVTDSKLRSVWGNTLHRISLISTTQKKKGKFIVRLQRAK